VILWRLTPLRKLEAQLEGLQVAAEADQREEAMIATTIITTIDMTDLLAAADGIILRLLRPRRREEVRPNVATVGSPPQTPRRGRSVLRLHPRAEATILMKNAAIADVVADIRLAPAHRRHHEDDVVDHIRTPTIRACVRPGLGQNIRT
jgi:hypothetical protein